VHIDKQEIVNLLRERGDHDKAQQAEEQLPDQVHHEEHKGLLEQIGINPQELLSRF
jgi:hypothetical protein